MKNHETSYTSKFMVSSPVSDGIDIAIYRRPDRVTVRIDEGLHTYDGWKFERENPSGGSVAVLGALFQAACYIAKHRHTVVPLAAAAKVMGRGAITEGWHRLTG